MNRIVWITGCIAALSLAGCRPSYDLVGAWKGSADTPQGPAFQHIDFEASHQFTSKTNVKTTTAWYQMTDTGRWTLDGDQLTYEFLDETYAIPGVDPHVAEPYIAALNAQRDAQLKELNARGKVTIRWIDEDHFIEVNADGEQAFERE